jgi:hypothetical protein
MSITNTPTKPPRKKPAGQPDAKRELVAEAPKRRGRPPGRRFTQEVPVYLTVEGEELAKRLAARRKMTVAKFFRTLLEEEAEREQLRAEMERSFATMTPQDVREYLAATQRDDSWVEENRDRL